MSIIPLILQPPPAMGVICCRMQTRHLIVGLALIVVSCASPDRNVYDFASREHARWAQQSREKAAADEATARSLAERGDHLGATRKALRGKRLATHKRSSCKPTRTIG